MQHNQNSKYKISVNQLADFIRGSEAKKKSIIRQQKNPAKIIVARYGLAKARFRKSLASKGDISPVLLGIEQLKAKKAETDWQANDKKISLEAMERFIKLKLPTLLQNLDSYEILPKFPANSFIFSGIDIILSPDLIVRGKIGEKTYIGALKIHVSKSSPFSINESEYVSTCIYNYLYKFASEVNAIVLPELCLCIDVFADSIVSAPKDISYLNLKLKSYCEDIIRIWDNVQNPTKHIITTPRFSKSEIKKAGVILKDNKNFSSEIIFEAERKLMYWRTVHTPILSELNQYLYYIGFIDIESLIMKRVKRFASIVNKLERNKNTNLTTMQDIAGCRVVLPNIEDVYKLYNILLTFQEEKFEIQEKHIKDYIQDPKNSGYRSIHIPYRFTNKEYLDGYDYLNIELQIRTTLQHIWATAVETIGIFKGFSLKTNQGPSEWLFFFKLAGAAFSIYENCPVDNELINLSKTEIFEMTLEQFKNLEVEKTLKGLAIAYENIKGFDSDSYNLIKLNLDDKTTAVENFASIDLENANSAYSNYERRIKNGENLNVVLVSTNTVKDLQESYPSYFGDANEFVKKIYEIEIFIKSQY